MIDEPPRYAVPHPGHPKVARKLYKVPVRIQLNSSKHCTTLIDKTVVIIARTVKEAANWVRDTLAFLPETEITAYGPRGGEIHRYIGYHSAIGYHITHGSHISEEEQRERLSLIFDDD